METAEIVQLKLKNNKTKNIDLVLFEYNKAFLQANGLKLPQLLTYEAIASKLTLDNIYKFMEGKRDNFFASITSVGHLKSDLDCTVGYTNQKMDKFLVTYQNSQFSAFFAEFNEIYSVALDGMTANCAMLDYQYIKMKNEFENKNKNDLVYQQKQLNDNQNTEEIKKRLFLINDEIAQIEQQVSNILTKIELESEQQKNEEKSYLKRKAKQLEELKQEDDKNKKIMQQIHKVQTEKINLEQQKKNLTESFNEILQKEVQKKLKEYQNTLRQKHKEEIMQLESKYNFDIFKRKKIAQEIAQLKNDNQSIQQSIDNTSKITMDILKKEQDKIQEYLELKNEIKELDLHYSELCTKSDQQNDILNCKFCGERPAQIIFRPCGHLLYCENCWIDYLTDERDPFINQTKYMCLVCLEFRSICRIEGFSEKID